MSSSPTTNQEFFSSFDPHPAPEIITLLSSDDIEFCLPLAAAKRSSFLARIINVTTVNLATGNKSTTSSSTSQKNNKDQDENDNSASSSSSLQLLNKIPLPNIRSDVLDVIVHFLCEAENSYQNAKKAGRKYAPLDVSSSLAKMDPSNSNDRNFVMEMMMACDYLGV